MHTSNETEAHLAKLKATMRSYKFWPVNMVAFARTLSYTIYGLALPNYLIYFRQVNVSLIGIIIACQAIAFIIGPLIAFPLTRRFGIRKIIIFSTTMGVILVGLQLIFFDPWVLIILRSLDGISLGFFWPNLQMEVSNWQRISPKKLADRHFRTYAMSWNSGMLIGQITGFLIVFIGQGNELLALIIAWIIMIFMIPCAISMEKEKICVKYIGNRAFAIDLNVKQKLDQKFSNCEDIPAPEESKDQIQENTLLALFPAVFYILGTLVYAYTKAFYPFIFPLYLNMASVPSYWVYLVTFLHQLFQVIMISIWSTRNVRPSYVAWMISIGLAFFFALGFYWLSGILFLAISFVLSGIYASLMYNLTSKIMLYYGAKTKSLSYASFYEIANGIGFGFAQLITGLIAEKNMDASFLFFAGFIGICFIGLWILSARARLAFRK